MKTSVLLLIAWTACSGCWPGYVIDPDLPDGHYRITLDGHDGGLEPAVRRWEPAQGRWKRHEKLVHGDGGSSTVEGVSSPSRVLLAARQRPTNRWCDSGTKFLHYMGVPPASKKGWHNGNAAAAQPPHHEQNNEELGTGEYTFLVDEEADRVESVDVDYYIKAELPLDDHHVECSHGSQYPSFQYALDPADYAASKQAFFNWCRVYRYRSEHIELALRGTVAVYVCHHARYDQDPLHTCSETEFTAAEAFLNDTCQQGPAWAYLGNRVGKRYGRSWKGEAICGANRQSPNDHLYAHHFVDERKGDYPDPWDVRNWPDAADVDREE